MRDAIAELVGRYVVRRRMERNLTQQECADRVGVSRQTLSMVERGVQTPGWESLYLLAEVLGCEPADLMPTVHQVRFVAAAKQVV